MNTAPDTPVDGIQQQHQAPKPVDWLVNLPNLLRILGTGVLLVAMYSFLVKGWQNGNDVFRYLMMLGHTGLLAVIGLASGHWLKESKGARLLITLALVSVPVNFAILGAFIFSQTAPVDLYQYPTYVAWTVNSLSTALLTSGGALLVLIPITVLGFMVLARSLSKQLSFLFLLNNAILLLPMRSPYVVGILVLVLTTLCLVTARQASRAQIAARTQEGLMALALLFLPLGIVMGRNLWLYSVELFMLTVLLTTVFFILRQASIYFTPGIKGRSVCDGLSLLAAIAVIPCLAGTLYDSLHVVTSLCLPLAAIAAGAMIYDIAKRNSLHATFYRHFAAGVLLICLTGNLILFHDLPAALMSILPGFGVILLGYHQKQRGLFISGGLLVLSGLCHQIYQLLHHFDLGSWVGLALLGIVSIVLASTIESQGSRFKARFDHWKDTIKQWDR